MAVRGHKGGFEEEMIRFQLEHLRFASLEVRQGAIDCLAEGLLKDLDRICVTRGVITQCVLFGPQTIRKNVILAMFKEKLRMGPKYYNIFVHYYPNYPTRIFLLTRFLHSHKFVLFPFLSLSAITLKFPRRIPMAIEMIEQRISPEDQKTFCGECPFRWCHHYWAI